MSLPPPSDPAAAAAAAAAQAAFRSFSTEAWTLLAVALLVTGIRTYSRVDAVGFKGLQPDDYLVAVGVVRFLPSKACDLMFVLFGPQSMANARAYNRHSTPLKLLSHILSEI